MIQYSCGKGEIYVSYILDIVLIRNMRKGYHKLALQKSISINFSRFDIFPGLTLLVHPTLKFKTVTIKAFVHRDLSEEATLLSVLESVLQSGTRKHPNTRKIQEFMDTLYGASFSTDVTKLGEQLLMTSAISCINDRFTVQGDPIVQKAIDFISQSILYPVKEHGLLKREYVELEKANLIKFLEAQINDRFSYAITRCIHHMCQGERFRINQHGDINKVDKISVAELTSFHKKIINESPIYIFVVGDVVPDKIAKKVHWSFKSISKRSNVKTPSPTDVKLISNGSREVKEKLELDQARIVLGYRAGISIKEKNFPAMLVFNGIFGAYPHSRLFTNVREKEGLSYMITSLVERSKGLLLVVAGINPRDYNKAVDMINNEMDSIRKGNVDESEIVKTKKLLINSVQAIDDSPSSRINNFLEMMLNNTFLRDSDMINMIQSVTVDDVIKASSKCRLDTIYFLGQFL